MVPQLEGLKHSHKLERARSKGELDALQGHIDGREARTHARTLRGHFSIPVNA